MLLANNFNNMLMNSKQIVPLFMCTVIIKILNKEAFCLHSFNYAKLSYYPICSSVLCIFLVESKEEVWQCRANWQKWFQLRAIRWYSLLAVGP